MKNIALITLFILTSAAMGLAQTRVEKKIPTRATGHGVTYFLPKTSLIFTVEVTKTTYKAGQFFRYSERYLGIKDVVMEDNVSYESGKISMVNKGIPDQENTYVVEFRSGTVAPFVYLTEDGLLCSINADFTPAHPVTERDAKSAESTDINVTSLYTQEFLMAGSVVRQAEEAAKQIHTIRERKMDILTGEADNMPRDGEAMRIVLKQLEDQEKAWTNLFVGSHTKEVSSHDITFFPQGDVNNEVLFRFSRRQGFLDADDLSGEPVYINLQVTERAPELPPKEAEKKEKAMKGIIYNLPGKARIEIKTAQNTLFRSEVQIAQFGTQESLAPVMFDDKRSPVKVTFYPETGAIRQINQ
jgi:hypothetical protein